MSESSNLGARAEESGASGRNTALAARLRAAGCVFAEEEAALLLEAATDDVDLERMVVARVGGEPLEYILGWAAFRGLRIAVTPGVFVPRVRTEFLAELAIGLVRDAADGSEGDGAPVRRPIVVDLCCGAGAIGAALLAERGDIAIDLYASDIDPDAVRAARANIGARGTVVVGDLFDPLPDRLRGHVAVIAVNAPYVPTDEIRLMPPEAREHEHLVALDGGTDGLALHRRIAREAAAWLRPGGSILIEAGEEQAPVTCAEFERHGLAARIATSDDYFATVVIGTRPTDG